MSMRSAVAVLIVALAAAAAAQAQDLPRPLVYALVPAPHIQGASDLTVTIRCGAHSVSMLDRVRSRSAATVATVMRTEQARIARGVYGFRTMYDRCTLTQVKAPLRHVTRVLRAKGIV
jgi:hypothetical protein